MSASVPEPIPQPDLHRETLGERLVRIETLMNSMVSSIQQHIRGEEKELKEVRILSEGKTKVIAWAAGVSATVSALWIVAGPKLAVLFGGPVS